MKKLNIIAFEKIIDKDVSLEAIKEARKTVKTLEDLDKWADNNPQYVGGSKIRMSTIEAMVKLYGDKKTAFDVIKRIGPKFYSNIHHKKIILPHEGAY